MCSLLRYRFIGWFEGDLQSRRKQEVSRFDDQILESDIDLIVGPGCPASEEDCVNQMSACDDENIENDQNKKIATISRMSEIVGGME